MAWSGQFTDFNNYMSPGGKRTNNPKQRFTKQQNPIEHGQGKSFVRLEDINLGNASIVNVCGIIIAKEAARCVQSRKNSGTERFVLNFTLRDHPLYYVNVTFWGKEQYIKDLTERFHISDIVSLSNVQVQAKPQDGSDEKFKCSTLVPFCISASENHSSIDWYNGPDSDALNQLQHVPVKPTNDFYTLEDITANGQSLHGEHVNILCVLRKIGQVKDITTKAGRQTQRCELRILDETCPSFGLVLWDKELIDLACTWIPLETVLFAADVKVTYDDYRSTMIATADCKTIVTVNPDTLEAQSLYQFAHSQDFLESDDSSENKKDPPLESITDIYNISQIKHFMEDMTNQWKPTVYGMTIVFLSQFNIDSEELSALRFRCEKCRETVTEDRGFMCTNIECAQGALGMFDASIVHKQPLMEYSVPVSLSDHTGTIDHCFLDGGVVEKLLGMKAEVFKDVDLNMKTELKWNFLLERFKVYFKIFKTSGGRGDNKAILKVISIEKAHPKDIPLFVNEM